MRTCSLFGESEVGDFEVPLLVQDNVLGLQVSVYDVVLVQALKCEDYLCGVKTRSVLVKALFFSKVVEEFACNRDKISTLNGGRAEWATNLR